MIRGVVVGLVEDNVDPEGIHRVLVKFPVDDEEAPGSSWCRMISPMSGKLRGLVILPDIGTEVIVGFAGQSMSGYILGAVYNGGEDLPEPYKNGDEDNNLRVFWSRNDHMVIFDDTDGAEKVSLGCKAGTRLDVTSGPIYQVLDAKEKVITQYSDKHTIWEAVETISIKCKDFKLEVEKSICEEAGDSSVYKASTKSTMDGGMSLTATGSVAVNINGGSPGSASDPLDLPEHKHPPCGG